MAATVETIPGEVAVTTIIHQEQEEEEVKTVVVDQATGTVSVTTTTTTTVTTSSRSEAALHIAGDTVSVIAPPAVSAGFSIAQYWVKFGFDTARFFIGGSAQVLNSDVLRGVDTIVGVAHEATKQSLNLAEGITQVSLSGSSWLLKQFGAKEGASLRIFFGEETADALSIVALCADEVYAPLRHLRSDQILSAVYALSSLQSLFAYEDVVEEKHDLRIAGLLEQPYMKDAHRMLKFASAAYGWQFCTALNILPVFDNVRTDRDCIKYLTGVEDIILEDWTSVPFRPGYFVCVDGETGSVIVAFRGTANLHDGLIDLSCTPCDFLGGKAHAGFVASAAKLSTALKPLIEDTLACHPGFKLVLTGHSLGAAMASMMAIDLVDAFPDLECYAFSAPCIASLDVSLLFSKNIFSFVHGPDMVSRWSLQTTKSLSQALETVHSYGSANVLSSFAKSRDGESAEEKDAAKAELRKLWEAVVLSQDASDYFFPAGKLIMIDPKFPDTRSGFMAHSDLGAILLFPEALSTHLPNTMLKSFDKISNIAK
jgi:hypothetical protein